MQSNLSRRTLLSGAAAALAAASLPRAVRAASPTQLGIDYAYYNPPSLVLKKFGWLEEALRPAGTQVNWVLSLGSNKANSYLASNAVQFGSTAGSAALLARINGSPIKTVYLYSQPEWTAIVVAANSSLRDLHALRGKKIAATKGTDPWFFLLRALRTVGLTQSDVEIVDLQHPDGRTALERGQVDAWAGLDPHMAASELDAGSHLIFRNVAFNTYGALNAREDFLHDHPDLVNTVLKAYERARRYAIEHPRETAAIVAEASHVELRVAQVMIRLRTRYPDPAPGRDYRRAIEGVLPIVRQEKLAVGGANLEAAISDLVETRIARAALAHG